MSREENPDMRTHGTTPLSLIALAALALCIVATGCTRNVMTVDPGRVEVEGVQPLENARGWSLWIDDVRDARPGVQPGETLIGELDQRFSDEPTKLYLAEPPADYLRAQLSAALLAQGLEAADARQANAKLKIELTRFEVVRDASQVLDVMTFYVTYKTFFSLASGKELGTVKVPASQQLKTTMVSDTDIGRVAREVLASTFKALMESDAFRLAVTGR